MTHGKYPKTYVGCLRDLWTSLSCKRDTQPKFCVWLPCELCACNPFLGVEIIFSRGIMWGEVEGVGGALFPCPCVVHLRRRVIEGFVVVSTIVTWDLTIIGVHLICFHYCIIGQILFIGCSLLDRCIRWSLWACLVATSLHLSFVDIPSQGGCPWIIFFRL